MVHFYSCPEESRHLLPAEGGQCSQGFSVRPDTQEAGGGPPNSWPQAPTPASHSLRGRIFHDETIPEAPQATFVTPAMLTGIDEEAFAGISAEVIEISGNVQWINRRAFADSDVKTVIIRNSNTWIDDSAFEGCGS